MTPLKRILFRGVKISFKAIWIISLSSCLTPIDFPTDKIGGKLVVSGQISTIPEQNLIQLGLTADSERLPIPLSGASVLLLDDIGQSYLYQEDPQRLGLYMLPDISGVPGRTYHVVVTTPSGEVYESVPEKMPPAAGELNTRYEFAREEYSDLEGIITTQLFIKIYLNATLPTETTPYVKWNSIESFLLSPTDFPDPFGNVPPPCFIAQNADPQRIVLFNGEEVKATTVNNVLVTSRLVDWSFFEKHYFTVYQSALTKEGHAYWRKVNILANQVGSIFDTPPAEIKGNLFNIDDPAEKIYGYFQATNETSSRFYLLERDLPDPLTVPDCLYDNRDLDRYPSRCLDCLTARNSSYNRPIWF